MSDQDVYESATVSEPSASPPTEEVVTEEPKAVEERTRDEKGRFAAKEEPVAVQEEPRAEPEKQDHRIPLTELLNEREKRQSEQRKSEQLARDMEELRRQLQQFQQPKDQPAPPPDQFQDPDAYNAYWERKLQEERMGTQSMVRNLEANFSLRMAHNKHGDTFQQAYDHLMQSADRNAAQAIINSPDPGETLVKWFKREQVLNQVGDDPNTFIQQKLDEALNDPEFLAKALEKARGVASTQPTQVKLPPSLNKATSAGRADDKEDMSDRGVYHYATGR